MALCGPRGVKFGLNAKQSFVLLARISDKVDPFNVLSMAESFWRLPGMFAAIVSAVLIYHGNPWLFGGLLLSSSLASYVFLIKKCIIRPIFTPILCLLKVYSLLTGYGLFVVGLSVFAYVRMGWVGIALYLGMNCVRIALDARLNQRVALDMIKNGTSYMIFEPYCFLLAFEYYARKFDRESSWTLQADTDDVAKAQIVFEELKSKWPMVVARFGDVEEGYELPVG